MLLRRLATLVAPLIVALWLIGCGGPSTSGDQASKDDQATAETAAADEGSDKASSPEEADAAAPVVEQPMAEQDDQRRHDAQPAPAEPRRAGGPTAPRHVATSTVGAGVRGDVGVFYDALDGEGSWVRHPDYGYVWIPGRTGPGWRPYQDGRWIWTNDYGWYWESEEPFAWAVYHYGRWDYDPDYGWFWVPGDVWAPAWVTWRFGGGSIGWAPIAPDRPGFASGLPRRYAPPIAESWVFVDARNFADPDLGEDVRPVSRIGASLAAATEIRTPRFENGRVVNRGAGRDEMQALVQRGIESREIVYVGEEDDSFDDVRGRRVGIFRPTIDQVEGGRAPRTLLEAPQTERVVIREYADPDVGRQYGAPSAALLDVLDNRERQGLVKARLNAQQAAVDVRIDQLQQERAALIEERRKEAKRLEVKIEKERQEAKAERRRNQQLVREQKQQRAAEINANTEAAGQEPSAAATPKGKQVPPETTKVVAPTEPAPAAASDAVTAAEPAPPPAHARGPEAPVETGAASGDGEAKGARDPKGQKKPGAQPAPAAEAIPQPAETETPKQAEGAPAPQEPPAQQPAAKPGSDATAGRDASPGTGTSAEPASAGAVPDMGEPQKQKRGTAAKPDAAKPDAAKPDAAKPDAAKPDAAKVDQPVAAKPEAQPAPATAAPVDDDAQAGQAARRKAGQPAAQPAAEPTEGDAAATPSPAAPQPPLAKKAEPANPPIEPAANAAPPKAKRKPPGVPVPSPEATERGSPPAEAGAAVAPEPAPSAPKPCVAGEAGCQSAE